jgi:hypothetical protein
MISGRDPMPICTEPYERANVRDLYWVAVYLRHLAMSARNASTAHGTSLAVADVLDAIAAAHSNRYCQAQVESEELAELLAGDGATGES